MKRAGFTLLELLIVMALIGLIAVMAIPKLSNMRERATLAAMKSDLRNLVNVEETYFAENLGYTADPGPAYTVSSGNKMPTIEITPDGWAATTTSNSGRVCAVFVGSTPAPPATKEGVPQCDDAEGTTRTP
jgi:prepilin-type N-terminal cleavage/methylation domain-containing protein